MKNAADALATLNRIAALWGGKLNPKNGIVTETHIKAIFEDARLYGYLDQARAILAGQAELA